MHVCTLSLITILPFLSQTNSFMNMSSLGIFKVAIIFSLIVLLPRSGGNVLCDEMRRDSDLEERKVVIGSKPPVCVNKCMKCRPCMATVVVNDHDHQRKRKIKGFKFVSSHEEDDSYYLLSWKCRCGNKLFQP